MNMGIVKCMLLAANGMTDFCKVGSRHLTRTSMEAVKKKKALKMYFISFIYPTPFAFYILDIQAKLR